MVAGGHDLERAMTSIHPSIHHGLKKCMWLLLADYCVLSHISEEMHDASCGGGPDVWLVATMTSKKQMEQQTTMHRVLCERQVCCQTTTTTTKTTKTAE
jgi:hypothetical protein